MRPKEAVERASVRLSVVLMQLYPWIVKDDIQSQTNSALSEAVSYRTLKYSSSICIFQSISDVFDPPCGRTDHALLGISAPTIPEVPRSKTRFFIEAF